MKRLLCTLIALFALCAQAVPTLVSSRVTLDAATTVAQFATTGAAGQNTAANSRHQISFNFVSNNFFACAQGHWGLMARASLEQIPSAQYRGVGFAAGDLRGASEMPGPSYIGSPFAVIETWGVGVMPSDSRYLFPKTISPKLYDNTLYKFTFESTRTINNFARLRIHMYNFPKNQFDLVFETGDVLDNNWGVDMGRESIVFFQTSGPGNCGYSLAFTNVWSTWTPAGPEMPDLTSLPLVRP